MPRFLLSILVAALLATACSPALNWRAVSLADGELKALLPCKPDRASRAQQLATQAIEITMLGCEADGALYAVSMATLPEPGQAAAVQMQWQSSLLANMRASASSVRSYAIKGAAQQFAPMRLAATGRQADGRPVQAEGVWFEHGRHLYHAVIYAEHIGAEMSEPFFDGLEFQ